MNRAFTIKGRCPGALRPMESGDGLIVRVRPRASSVSPEVLGALGHSAGAFGNGLIELTCRSNIQLRGVSQETLPPLLDELARLKLTDPDADAETIRNIVVSPLSGADPDEVIDMRAIANLLEQQLLTVRCELELPAKFGFILDGNGALSIRNVRADIYLAAVRVGTERLIAVGLDRASGETLWAGLVSQDEAAAAAMAITRFISSLPDGKRARLRALNDSRLFDRVIELVRPYFREVEDQGWRGSLMRATPALELGVRHVGSQGFACHIGVPWGRLEDRQACQIADAAQLAGAGRLDVTPWRSIVIPVATAAAAERLCAFAVRIGLIVAEDDPRRRIEVCPGRGACPGTTRPTRDDAEAIAGLLKSSNFKGRLHISGCSKGCALPRPAALVLVGDDNGYGVVRNGTARDAVVGWTDLSDIEEWLARTDACATSK